MDTSSDPLIARLQMLAAVAVRHAAEFHGIVLGDDPAVIDAILADEAERPEQAGTVATCYGAWFGELLARRLGGRWIALHEPTAPRIALARAVVSPIDALRRRLRSGQAAAAAELFARAQEWAAAADAQV